MPQFHYGKIKLVDIESVNIARIKYFEQHSDQFTDQGLRNLISEYRNLRVPIGSSGLSLSASIGSATGHTPLIYIASKDKASTKGFSITTKPFSKKAIQQLVQELRMRDIVVNTEPELKLG